MQKTISFAQTITLTSAPSPVNGTICPGIPNTYSIDTPNGCVPTWSATNGQLNTGNGQNTISVTWSDTPGATATLKVTFSGQNCSASDATWSALILSVNGQSFGGSSSSTVNVDYCTTQSVSLTVPPMYVQGTGGAGQPPIQEVVYDWTLPAGWAASSGTLTSVPNIVIHPTGCARPGAVQVRGTIYNRCGSAAESAAVTFNLTSAQPGVTITVPQGYSGSTACNTTPVTFTAYVNPNVGCVSGYNWSQYPSGWTLLSQSGNTATFRPSGTSADSDPNSPFKVTVNYSCGTSIVSGGYNPAFIAPTVTGPSTVCSSGTSFTVSNVTSQAFPINWSSSDASIVSFPNPTSTGASNTVNIGVNGNATISATTSCGVVATPINVYAGLPSMTLSNDGGTGPYPLCGTGSIAYTAMQDHIISASLGGATSVNYSLNGPAGVVSGSALSATAYDYISQSSTANFSITAATSNSCGSVSQCLSFSNGTCSAPTISSTTINGSTWYGDCQSNYFTFSTGPGILLQLIRILRVRQFHSMSMITM